MSSATVRSDQQMSPSSSSQAGISNGSSFDILSSYSNSSSGSQPPSNFGTLNLMGQSLTDITLEQAVVRIQELSKDNAELREYMKENNEKMRQQFETLSQWKQKVHDTNEMNAQKFEQTRALITALRKENEELQKKYFDGETERKQLQSQIRNLEEENKSIQLARIASGHVIQDLKEQAEEKGVNVTLPNKECDMSEMVLVASADKEQKIQELETDLRHRLEEIEQLKKTVVNQEEQMKQFRSSTEQLLNDLVSTQKLKEDIQKENQMLSQNNLQLSQRLQELLADTKTSLQIEKDMVSRIFSLGSAGEGLASEVSQVRDLGSKADPEKEEYERRVEILQQEGTAAAIAVRQNRSDADKARLEKQIGEEKAKFETVKKERDSLCKEIQEMRIELQKKDEAVLRSQQQHQEEMAHLSRQYEEKLTTLAHQEDADRNQQMKSLTENFNTDIHSLRSQVLTLISEVTELSAKNSAATNACEKKDQRIKEVEQRNARLMEDLQNQRQAVMALQGALANNQQSMQFERREHETAKKQANQLRDSFNQLVEDYRELLDTFDQYKTQFQQDQNRDKNRDEINHLTVQVLAAEEALGARDEQIKKLKDEIHGMKQEYENNVAVLQAQADIFRADFDAERKAREQQVTEKDKIIQEMNNLQIQNQQLIDELDNYSRRQLSEMQRKVNPNQHHYMHLGTPNMSPYRPQGAAYPGSASGHAGGDHPMGIPEHHMHSGGQLQSRPSQPSQHEEEEAQLLCPKCFLQCPDLDTLQLHVIDCMDQYDEPSSQR